VDIVVCNAAILFFAHTLELKDEQLQKAYDVNVLGTLFVCFTLSDESSTSNFRQSERFSAIWKRETPAKSYAFPLLPVFSVKPTAWRTGESFPLMAVLIHGHM
jgi:NAD(P)-dependent dehydrogenase (short-subunit alcohol dehydrogenase family)